MIFLKIFTKYSTHHSLSANTGFISIFTKGRNFTKGDNSKKKYASAIFP